MKYAFFIHIPKTGGSSISRIPFVISGTKGYQHKPIRFFYDMMDFKFTWVRNPFDRFASGVLNHHYAKPHNFNEFVTGKFLEEHERWFADWEWVHLIPQHRFVMADGKNQMDFIGKFENMVNDWNEMCDLLGVERCELPHENQGNFKGFYDKIWSREAKEIVTKVYEADFRIFEY